MKDKLNSLTHQLDNFQKTQSILKKRAEELFEKPPLGEEPQTMGDPRRIFEDDNEDKD